MRIKNAEGQTLLTLMRVAMAFIACLCVGNVQQWADSTFYFFNNAETIVKGFLGETGEAGDTAVSGEPVSLYYTQAEEDGNGTYYVYRRYYLTGAAPQLGLCDADGEQVLPPTYEDIIILPHAFALRSAGQWQFADRDSLQPLNDLTWDNVVPDTGDNGLLASNLVLVEKDGLFGAVNLTGELVIDPEYEDFHIYSYAAPWQLIRVKQDDKWGFIDLEGNTVVRMRYDYALLDVMTVYEDENDAEGQSVPVIYVLDDGDWGGIFRDSQGQARAVDWDIEPTEAALADYEQQLQV